VLSIQFTEGLGHEVCVFEHSDNRIWVYDPSLDAGYGNFGGSCRLRFESREPLFIAAQVAVRSGKKVKSGRFL
jgi:hypothetical protein